MKNNSGFKACLPVFLLLVSPVFISAESLSAGDGSSWDLTQLLGMTPAQALEILGPPAEVYTQKVAESLWQPVFYHPQQLYLFFHQNRVWQVRLDRRYAEAFQGITMGRTAEEVKTLLGPPKSEDPGQLVYDLPYRNFPRRMRFILWEGKVSDIFLYRSDF